MKKISVISFVILSILLSAFSLPAQGQFEASQSCRLVEDIDIAIRVDGTPTNDITRILENSLVSSIAAQMMVAGPPIATSVLDQMVPPNTDAPPSAAQAAAIANEWGTICLVNTINNIINWIFFILLTVAFFLIVVAAFIWTTSAGDATKQENARNIIIAAMVGIVIALFAQLIPAVVLGIVT